MRKRMAGTIAATAAVAALAAPGAAHAQQQCLFQGMGVSAATVN